MLYVSVQNFIPTQILDLRYGCFTAEKTEFLEKDTV
jgi:hypothetical protein